MGKMIQIPGEYFDKIGKSILKLKILIMNLYYQMLIDNCKGEWIVKLSLFHIRQKANLKTGKKNRPHFRSVPFSSKIFSIV